LSGGILARRYVAPLFEVAREKGVIPQVAEDIKSLDEALRVSPEFKSILINPSISRKTKRGVVEKMFGGASPFSLNFMRLVIDKNRADIFLVAHHLFQDLLDEMRSVKQGMIQSAVAVSDSDFQTVKEALEKRFRVRLDLRREILPELIGGLRIQIGNTVIDASVKNRLQHLRKALAGA